MTTIQDLSRRMDMTISSNTTTATDSASIIAAQKLDPWTGQWKYARAFAIFFCAFVALFTFLHILRVVQDRKRLYSNKDNSKSSLWDRGVALTRSLTYRRLSLPGTPSLGVCILILSCLVFTVVWTFTVRPYYRPLRSGGSPPLSLRSGMFAVGMTPFLYLLAFKANLITYLTGTSHEKLNALHRWGGRIVFLLSMIHMVPFMIQPSKEGGIRGLRKEFYSDYINRTGCLALGSLGWLVFASWAPLRRICYEFFVYSHIIGGILYLAFMFWHCQNLLTSWNYLWATVAIWLFSLLVRFAQMNWFTTVPSTLKLLPSNAISVTIPTTLTWKPGQHVFLRFPGLAPFDNHPFSISSAPATNTKGYELNSLELLIKPYSGFTKRLLSYTTANPDSSPGVVVDGPYGGIPRAVEAFQTVVLFAGGSGITAVVGVLLYLTALMKGTKAGLCTKQIKLVWAVRDQSALEWFRQEIIDAVGGLPRGTIEYRFHVTGGAASVRNSGDKEIGFAVGEDGEVEGVESGRPDCDALLNGWVEEMGARTCVIVSGPAGLRNNVANSVAQLQRRVGENELQEIYLHTETFDW